MTPTTDLLAERDTFARRHLGPREHEIADMLATLGHGSLDELCAHVVPKSIQLGRALELPAARSESRALADLRAMAQKNEVFRSFIGMGYSGCLTPGVILRNVLENPGWYTQYTPYQAEIAQGRMEALINFQTMIADLTALPLANASLLDEGTAVAEAMHMCQQASKGGKNTFFLAADLHPQSIAVVKTRALPLGIDVVVGDPFSADFAAKDVFGVVVQYPTTDGRVEDYAAVGQKAHAAGALFVVAADLLALTVLKAPGEFGADVCVGSAQRFGVPMGFGGPHAAFMSTKDEYKRIMPGRLIGVSKDVHGRPGYRLSLQTREQHIRRDKATSNICTAQVLLAVMASMYAVYHGP
ncbi:MAG: glycine dehydrogenase (aminomethyl-transferring), partial [Vicinamibacteria bacterium]|nr:glycine dehydrogenase (aminomethyl-transferring) [Vicinamibacteria bacterium]